MLLELVMGVLNPGEEDQDAYDINKLKKPVTTSSSGSQPDDKQTQLSSSDTLPLRGNYLFIYLFIY